MSHLPLTDATALAERLYGIRAVASGLPSERDQNILLRTEVGERFILKLANIAERREVLDAECAVMRHLETTGLVPRLIRTIDGADIATWGPHFVRLISALPGTTLGTARLRTDALRRDLGRALGRVDRSLATFDHPAFHRDFHWDLAASDRVIRSYLPLVSDADMGAMPAISRASGRDARRSGHGGQPASASSSTSNFRVALGGITPPAPRAP